MNDERGPSGVVSRYHHSVESENHDRVDANMSPRVAIVVAGLLRICFATDPSIILGASSNSALSDSEQSDVQSRNSVATKFVARTSENEIPSDDIAYLENFKSLHNSTDLQALPSDVQTAVISDKQDTLPSDRADMNLRVLRGIEGELPGLEHAIFTPAYKHNTIDTADFSDCALQGEWQPIGVPSNHYIQHEDHQKEHFHAAAEGPDAFPTLVIPASRPPIDPEGAAFWNQFLTESKGNPLLMSSSYQNKKPKPTPTDNPQPGNPIYHQKKRQQPRPPPGYSGVDIPNNGRRPHPADVNSHKRIPSHLHHSAPMAQALVNTKPTINDIDFALVRKPPKSGSEATFSTHNKDVDFLSPPPAPHRFNLRPISTEKHKAVPTRQKFIHKQPPHFVRGHLPHKPPPTDVEQYEFPRGQSYPKINPSDSSTFTCGHQHSHGTNYHTASYQVEGEADPSLLDENSPAANQYPQAQIILGQPQSDHDAVYQNEEHNLFNNLNIQRYPKSGTHDQDLKEEGTATGESENDEIAKELEKLNGYAENVKQTNIETATEENSLQTTAPQTFQSETDIPVAIIFRDSIQQADSVAPSFSSGFDHSAFAKVDLSHQGSDGSSPKFTHNDDSKFQINPDENRSSHVIVHQEQTISHSQPNSFFGQNIRPFLHETENKPLPTYRQVKYHSNPYHQSPPTSFFEFSPNNHKSKSNGKFHKESIPIYYHYASPNNSTKSHMTPKKKRPPKDYEVSENGGEMIPLSAFFPPRQGPTQFDNRQPNFAGPKGKRPKYQSTIHYDGSGLEIHQTRPKNAVTRIKLKTKSPKGASRYNNPEFRKSLTIKSQINT